MIFLLAFAAMQDMPSAAPPTAPAAEEKKICRRPASVGTRIAAKRECRTAAEWKEIDQNSGLNGMNGLSGTQNRRQ